MKHPFVDAKLNWSVFLYLILKNGNTALWLGLFILIIFTLQWLFNIDQLIEVVLGDSGLSFGDRIDYLIDGFINIFRFINDFVPIAMILIAFMQAVTITLLLRYQSIKKLRASQGASIGLSLVGVGCVACGGSILTPLLGLVATNVSVSFADAISNVLLFIALVLSYVTMTKTSYLVAKKL